MRLPKFLRRKKKLLPYEKLNIKYADYILIHKNPPSGTFTESQILNDNYFDVTPEDNKVYSEAGKVANDEIRGFLVNYSYIIKDGGGTYTFTEAGRLAKLLEGHLNY